MEEALFDIILPILEGSMVLAAHYAKGCNRDTVTSMDINYAMKYLTMNHVGDKIGSLFPEIYESESSDEEDIEVDDGPEVFTRYPDSGGDDWCLKMNKSYDSWESWTPTCMVEASLKKTIDEKKNICEY
jgi:hypothetical protein